MVLPLEHGFNLVDELFLQLPLHGQLLVFPNLLLQGLLQRVDLLDLRNVLLHDGNRLVLRSQLLPPLLASLLDLSNGLLRQAQLSEVLEINQALFHI